MIKGKPVNVIKTDNKVANFNTKDGELIITLFKRCFITSLKDSIKKNQSIIFLDPKDGSSSEVSVEKLKRIVKELEEK